MSVLSEFSGLWNHAKTQHALTIKWQTNQLVDCCHYINIYGSPRRTTTITNPHSNAR